jgi:hypothetical protein
MVAPQVDTICMSLSTIYKNYCLRENILIPNCCIVSSSLRFREVWRGIKHFPNLIEASMTKILY